MLIVRTEISKWAALINLIPGFPMAVGLRLTNFNLNSISTTLNSVEIEENEQIEENPAYLRQSDGDDDSGSQDEEFENEIGVKERKKRKRIITRARKVIPGLSFLVLHFLLEY